MLRLTIDPDKSWWTLFQLELKEHLRSFIDPGVVAAMAVVGLVIAVITVGVFILSIACGR